MIRAILLCSLLAKAPTIEELTDGMETISLRPSFPSDYKTIPTVVGEVPEFTAENASKLKILNIEGVEPTAQTTEDSSYPLARPLFIYSAKEVMAEKPQVAAFINYYLTYVSEEITEVGYFPASEAALTGRPRATSWRRCE